jgi:YHS domain-containing protein
MSISAIFAAGIQARKLTATRTKQEVNALQRDPVCGMEVDPQKTTYTSEYHGQKHYFCSFSYKQKFDSNPQHYTPNRAS